MQNTVVLQRFGGNIGIRTRNRSLHFGDDQEVFYRLLGVMFFFFFIFHVSRHESAALTSFLTVVDVSYLLTCEQILHHV